MSVCVFKFCHSSRHLFVHIVLRTVSQHLIAVISVVQIKFNISYIYITIVSVNEKNEFFIVNLKSSVNPLLKCYRIFHGKILATNCWYFTVNLTDLFLQCRLDFAKKKPDFWKSILRTAEIKINLYQNKENCVSVQKYIYTICIVFLNIFKCLL